MESLERVSDLAGHFFTISQDKFLGGRKIRKKRRMRKNVGTEKSVLTNSLLVSSEQTLLSGDSNIHEAQGCYETVMLN